MMHRRFAALVAGSALLLGACGGDDLPSKADFISDLQTSMADQVKQLEDAGMDKADAEKIVSDFASCSYDKIKDNEDLLREVANDKGDDAVTAQVQEKAAACVEDLTKAVTEAVTGG